MDGFVACAPRNEAVRRRVVTGGRDAAQDGSAAIPGAADCRGDINRTRTNTADGNGTLTAT